jgi:hypothetical protein
MNWEWLIQQGLIKAEPNYYPAKASPEEINHAIEVAYKAANDEQRKTLVDMIWSEGKATGEKTYWYQNRSGEVQDLAAAYSGVRVSSGTTGTEIGEGSKLRLPGNFKLWLNSETGKYHVVSEVPAVTTAAGKSEPLYISWVCETDADLEAVVGAGEKVIPAFTGTTADFTSRGVIDFGGVDEIRPFGNIEGDPFDTWVEDYARFATTKPWILDPDFIQMAVEASMERADGQVTIEEIQSTKWWKEHTVSERQWMETYYGDPATAEQLLEDNREDMKARLAKAGIDNVTDEVAAYMADQTTMGRWSSYKLQAQITALADPWSSDTIDEGLFQFMAGQGWVADTTRKEEDTVRSELSKWLGPVWGNWSDVEIAAKAGELRNNSDGLIEFVESLKDQRMAMYPNHTDRNLSYEAIAQPWRSYAQSVWGTPIEDTDNTFQSILQVNNPVEAGKMLRREGLNRGVARVFDDMMTGVETGQRTNVRGAV